jgi:hypothetical protein
MPTSSPHRHFFPFICSFNSEFQQVFVLGFWFFYCFLCSPHFQVYLFSDVLHLCDKISHIKTILICPISLTIGLYWRLLRINPLPPQTQQSQTACIPTFLEQHTLHVNTWRCLSRTQETTILTCSSQYWELSESHHLAQQVNPCHRKLLYSVSRMHSSWIFISSVVLENKHSTFPYNLYLKIQIRYIQKIILLGWGSTGVWIWPCDTSPALFAFVIFWIGSCVFAWGRPQTVTLLSMPMSRTPQCPAYWLAQAGLKLWSIWAPPPE